MTEYIDRNIGIVRHEYGTMSPELCRRNIEKLAFVKNKYVGKNAVQYTADYKGFAIDIQSTPTRTILFCENRYALSLFENLLKPKEWEYDNVSDRTDYLRTK